MPELPDVTVYLEAIERAALGHRLVRVRALNPFVLRSVDPPLAAFRDLELAGVLRIGKRIVLAFPGELFLVIHLMIAGRLLWRKSGEGGVRPMGKLGLAAFDFDHGMMLLTEASTHKRAMLHAVHGEDELERMRPTGVEPLECGYEEFAAAVRRENRTLKRALTSPALFSGIGNAYSDEILHAARLSPVRLTQALSDEEVRRLFEKTRETLEFWIAKLRADFGARFPDRGQITAFRPDFAAHGKYGKPCPVCGKPIQRIVYAENETNYCAVCQNEGRMLADRSLSRLLKDDWPKTMAEMLGE